MGEISLITSQDGMFNVSKTEVNRVKAGSTQYALRGKSGMALQKEGIFLMVWTTGMFEEVNYIAAEIFCGIYTRIINLAHALTCVY